MALVEGQRASDNITQALRKVDIADRVLELQPDQQPLTVFTSKLSRKPAVNAKYSWAEDDLLPRYDRINNGAGYTSGNTALVVDNGTYFSPGDLVFVSRTGEMLRVSSISTNTLTVVRAIGSTAAALVDNDELIIVGSAQMEGDTARAAKSTNPAEVVNYTEIFERTLDETETLRHSDQFTRPHDWDRQKMHVALEHQKDKEFAFIFGRPSEDNTGTNPRRTTAGCLHYIATNQTDAGGTLTEAEFFGALRPIFRWGRKDKIGLCAPLPVDVLNTFPRGKVQVTDQSDSRYGVNVVRYVSPHGTFHAVTHWQLEGDKYGGYIIVLDLEQISYRYLANENGSRDTHWNESIQANNVDSRQDQVLAEVGLQFGLEKTHGLISNITG